MTRALRRGVDQAAHAARAPVWSLVALLAGHDARVRRALVSRDRVEHGGRAPGGGDNDVVMDSLCGVYVGQVAVATLGRDWRSAPSTRPA